MATLPNGTTPKSVTVAAQETREWNLFAYRSFSTICARKHGIVVPTLDESSVSDAELDRRVRLISELAHLPPG